MIGKLQPALAINLSDGEKARCFWSASGAFMASVDSMVMGRKCMEMISNMNLSPDQWPYGDIHIVVLSNMIKTPPKKLRGKVEMFSGKIMDFVKELESKGLKHAYIDGCATIT